MTFLDIMRLELVGEANRRSWYMVDKLAIYSVNMQYSYLLIAFCIMTLYRLLVSPWYAEW